MKIVYLGDSVTDAGKNIHSGGWPAMGQGYALLSAARLAVEYPGQFTFVNSGIGGHRVVDLYSRIKSDVWNHEPDVLSILVGVNDILHEMRHNNGVETDRFERVLTMLVKDTQERLPNIKILLMEPFVLPNCENPQVFCEGTAQRAAAVRRVAEACGTAFLPLQQMLDQACNIMPANYWLHDGVHPAPAGHQLIADAWLKLFREQFL